MPGIEPAAVEDALLLVAEELGIAIDLRAEAEDARFLVLDKKGIDTVPAVWGERVHQALRSKLLLERGDPGLGAAEDEGVDVVRALIGVNGLEIHHMPDHRIFVDDAV